MLLLADARANIFQSTSFDLEGRRHLLADDEAPTHVSVSARHTTGAFGRLPPLPSQHRPDALPSARAAVHGGWL